MSEGLFSNPDQNTLYFSRTDVNEIFGAWSKHPFVLEEKEWPSVEHYFQAMKFNDIDYQEKIRQASHPKQARKLGKKPF